MFEDDVDFDYTDEDELLEAIADMEFMEAMQDFEPDYEDYDIDEVSANASSDWENSRDHY